MKFVITCCLVLLAVSSHSQSLSINTDGSTANASAILDVKSAAKGMLIPRMSKTEKNAIASPATGLLIFQNAPDSIGFYYYNGTGWLWLEVLGTAGWKTKGNAGTDTSVNFIGTTDIMPIRFKQNSKWMGQLNSNNGTYFLGSGAGENSVVTGTIAIGDSALANAVLVVENLAIGYNALKDNTQGHYNTAVGYEALKVNNNSTGFNIAFGNRAARKNVVGWGITAVGSQALASDTSQGYNTAIGLSSMAFNTHGFANTAVGANSLVFNKTGEWNTAIGANAMYSANKTNYNVAVGAEALYLDTSGYNTAVGTLALRNNKQGIENSALGYYSLFNNTSGTANTGLGSYSFLKNTTGSYGIAIGDSAGFNNTTGSSNIFIGHQAGYTNSTGDRNIAIGNAALRKSTSVSGLISVGDSAGYNNTSGIKNIFIGEKAGYTNSSGGTNILIGANAGAKMLFGDGNVFIGDSTGASMTNFGTTSSVFIGDKAGSKTDNEPNTFIGNYAGRANTNGIYNCFIGTATGYQSLSGSLNTFLGEEAGLNFLSGSGNVLLGYATGVTLTSGNSNTLLGTFANVGSDNLFNASAIGNRARVDTSNALVLGSINGVNGATANTRVGIGTTAPDYRLHVSGSRTNDGGWADGIVVENTGTTGEAAISFRNTTIPSTRQWTIGMNQTTYLAFSYGGSFAASTTRLAIDTLGNVGVGTTAPAAVIDVDGTYKLGTNGSINTALIKDTVSINVGSVPANGELDVTVAFANATLNGAVSISPATDIESGLVIAWARVSAAGIIKIRYRNLTGAIINPVTTNYYISVVQ